MLLQNNLQILSFIHQSMNKMGSTEKKSIIILVSQLLHKAIKSSTENSLNRENQNTFRGQRIMHKAGMGQKITNIGTL